MIRRTAKLFKVTAGSFFLGVVHGYAEAKAERLAKKAESVMNRAQNMREVVGMLKVVRRHWLQTQGGMSADEAHASVEYEDGAEVH